MTATAEVAPKVGTKAACSAMKMPRATFYRQKKPAMAKPAAAVDKPTRRSPLALSEAERATTLELLRSERFVDCAPRQVYAQLLDQGLYLCSPRTMYRLLKQHDELRERRHQRRHPVYSKPELLATAPNQLWSWDITKLKGPTKGSTFALYTIIDVFSRYTVAWMVADSETALLAERLINEAYRRHDIAAQQLTIHADRGAAMTAASVADLMKQLGIKKSHSRPRISNDNPYSESQFKTLKYHQAFPERFDSLEDAKAFCRPFFDWYNNEHRHSGIELLTPADVHYGRTEKILALRQAALNAAFIATPHRFKNRPPIVKSPPVEVWINPPSDPATSKDTSRTTRPQEQKQDSAPLLSLLPSSSASDDGLLH